MLLLVVALLVRSNIMSRPWLCVFFFRGRRAVPLSVEGVVDEDRWSEGGNLGQRQEDQRLAQDDGHLLD